MKFFSYWLRIFSPLRNGLASCIKMLSAHALFFRGDDWLETKALKNGEGEGEMAF